MDGDRNEGGASTQLLSQIIAEYLSEDESSPNHVLPHPSTVSALAFSPDGRLLATGGDDCVVRLWDVETGSLRGKPLAHPRPVGRLSFDPEGKRLAVVCERDILFWHVETRQRIGPSILHPTSIGLLQFAPTGQSLLTSGDDCMLRWWPVRRTVAQSAADVRTQIESLSGLERDEVGHVRPKATR